MRVRHAPVTFGKSFGSFYKEVNHRKERKRALEHPPLGPPGSLYCGLLVLLKSCTIVPLSPH